MIYATSSSVTVTNTGDIDHAHGAKADAEAINGAGTTTGVKFDYNENTEQNNDPEVYHHVTEGTAVAGNKPVTGTETWKDETAVEAAAEAVVDTATNKVLTVLQSGNKITKMSLQDFRDQWNDGIFADDFVSATLTANVDVKEENWGPIGTWEYPFHGTFDGNDKKVLNLSNNSEAASDGKYTHIYSIGKSVGYGETYGFFGIVGGGDFCIKDITFDNVSINVANGKNVGAVIGYIPKQGDSFDEHTISAVGKVSLENVTVNGSVQAKNHVAGIVGKIYSAGEISITNCANNANVTASGGFCGGILGILSSDTLKVDIENCYNYGNITNSGGDVAGLFGELLAAGNDGVINVANCHNAGSVSRTGNGINSYGVAGVAFVAQATTANLKNLSNSGTISYTTNYGNMSANGILCSKATNTILEGAITNTGDVTSQVRSNGIMSLEQSKSYTLKNATIKNSGKITASIAEAKSVYAGGLSSYIQASGITIEGTSSFENTGDICAENNLTSIPSTKGEYVACAGGVFGHLATPTTEFTFNTNIHDCSISAKALGMNMHTENGSENDYACAGGFAGRLDANEAAISNVSVKNVTISTTVQTENNEHKYGFAGGFAGIIRFSGSQETANQLTNAEITNNTFNSNYHGIVLGFAYDCNGGNNDNCLNYSGTIDEGDALGGSYSTGGIITPVNE